MRTYARVDLARLASNYQSIAQAAPHGRVLAVLKADAYGHGAVEVARTLLGQGCTRLAVATLEEAGTLREAGIDGEIVLLSGFFAEDAGELARLRVTPMIHDAELLTAWRAKARELGRPLPWHLEVDTGMCRTGLRFDSPAAMAAAIRDAPELQLEGVATHLAAAEDFHDDSAGEQLDAFRTLIDGVSALGVAPGLIHASNSAATAYRGLEGQDLLRPGLALYGYLSRPRGDGPEARIDIRPALSWRARVLSVRRVAAGDRLGYNGIYQARESELVAVLGVGYADGFRRELSNTGAVVLGGRRRRVLGRVSMDITLVQADESVRTGDEATLLGDEIHARDIAEMCGTISYEILCGISKRVPRVYAGLGVC